MLGNISIYIYIYLSSNFLNFTWHGFVILETYHWKVPQISLLESQKNCVLQRFCYQTQTRRHSCSRRFLVSEHAQGPPRFVQCPKWGVYKKNLFHLVLIINTVFCGVWHPESRNTVNEMYVNIFTEVKCEMSKAEVFSRFVQVPFNRCFWWRLSVKMPQDTRHHMDCTLTGAYYDGQRQWLTEGKSGPRVSCDN